MILATIFVIVMAISLINALFIFQGAVQFLISGLREKVDVSVYFNEDVLEEEILEIKKEIANVPDVKDIRYVSREMASENFIQRYKDNLVLMEALEIVEDNPFLASLNIKMEEPSQYDTMTKFVEDKYQDKIYKVNYYQNKQVIEKLFSISSDIKKFGAIFSLFLSILAILVSFNTIRLAIHNVKEEIEIQRLVGASNWFIRGPFMIQGIIAGVFATAISFVCFAASFYFLNPGLKNLFLGFDFFAYFLNNFYVIIAISLICGVGIGVLSSLIAMRKYLRI